MRRQRRRDCGTPGGMARLAGAVSWSGGAAPGASLDLELLKSRWAGGVRLRPRPSGPGRPARGRAVTSRCTTTRRRLAWPGAGGPSCEPTPCLPVRRGSSLRRPTSRSRTFRPRAYTVLSASHVRHGVLGTYISYPRVIDTLETAECSVEVTAIDWGRDWYRIRTGGRPGVGAMCVGEAARAGGRPRTRSTATNRTSQAPRSAAAPHCWYGRCWASISGMRSTRSASGLASSARR